MFFRVLECRKCQTYRGGTHTLECRKCYQVLPHTAAEVGVTAWMCTDQELQHASAGHYNRTNWNTRSQIAPSVEADALHQAGASWTEGPELCHPAAIEQPLSCANGIKRTAGTDRTPSSARLQAPRATADRSVLCNMQCSLRDQTCDNDGSIKP